MMRKCNVNWERWKLRGKIVNKTKKFKKIHLNENKVLTYSRFLDDNLQWNLVRFVVNNYSNGIDQKEKKFSTAICVLSFAFCHSFVDDHLSCGKKRKKFHKKTTIGMKSRNEEWETEKKEMKNFELWWFRHHQWEGNRKFNHKSMQSHTLLGDAQTYTQNGCNLSRFQLWNDAQIEIDFDWLSIAFRKNEVGWKCGKWAFQFNQCRLGSISSSFVPLSSECLCIRSCGILELYVPFGPVTK